MNRKEPTILVVDDEVHLCNILYRILTAHDYRVKIVTDGKSALEMVEKISPDVIILDLMMPGVDGREVCSVVRQISSKTRVIYFSAKVEPDSARLKELRQESDSFIAKPATAKKLLSIVEKVLKTESRTMAKHERCKHQLTTVSRGDKLPIML
jgi:DNA-binding response OmpR family regulator